MIVREYSSVCAPIRRKKVYLFSSNERNLSLKYSKEQKTMVPVRIELTTSALLARRSNQLS